MGDRVDQRVREPLQGASAHARRRIGRQHRSVRVAIVEVGDDVGGIDHEETVIVEHRHLDARVHGREHLVRPRLEGVDCFVVEPLVVENQADFARERAEGVVVELHDAGAYTCREPRGSLACIAGTTPSFRRLG